MENSKKTLENACGCNGACADTAKSSCAKKTTSASIENNKAGSTVKKTSTPSRKQETAADEDSAVKYYSEYLCKAGLKHVFDTHGELMEAVGAYKAKLAEEARIKEEAERHEREKVENARASYVADKEKALKDIADTKKVISEIVKLIERSYEDLYSKRANISNIKKEFCKKYITNANKDQLDVVRNNTTDKEADELGIMLNIHDPFSFLFKM